MAKATSSSSKKMADKLKKLPPDTLVCSGCLKSDPEEEDGFSLCCHEIILSASEFLGSLSGQQIPKVQIPKPTPPPAGEVEKKKTSSGKKKGKGGGRDAKSGIRKGTTKYEVYLLWDKGKDIPTIIKELSNKGIEANPNSVRSWVGRFDHRYKGDK